MTSTRPDRVIVIGCGLIGTSVALALTRAGVRVALDDVDTAALDEACRMGAGTALTEDTPVADLVVIATPPSAVVDTLYRAQARGLGRAYTDVASTKEHIWAEAALRGSDLLGYVPGHPMAGRELSGPGAAVPDLFAGRPWILCPYPTVDPEALAAVDALVRLCGGVRRDLTPAAHDRAAAALSHVPQVVSSALAGQLAGLGPDILALAGAGVTDTTRTAGSDPALWADILGQNASVVAEAVERLAGELGSLARELRAGGSGPSDGVRELLDRGNAGRAALLAAAGTTAANTAAAGPAAGPAAPAPARTRAAAAGTRTGPPYLPPHRPYRSPLLRPGRPAGPVPRIRRFAR
ncbi:prephenate dehydrogenase/arogenate dehydrogenase family protein [Streptomyces sp. NBC_00654]|uniref:prephenate dehydrogenase n=1 Tax=Streptomyces sp. NBC_00654 TaxID=2975799 RepID=UPI00224EADB0|nr:prephenate dehydrogenase/arogenate dehydrogenase family protein [Streptomyces sp. NBC_00654]MCX4970615.1 prephenate dehydrogenase/arogenate dehydrogenase family protein [Streptomyces sp. NBC_00654]